MKQKLFVCLVLFCISAKSEAQVHVYNKGGVYISGDTVFFGGNLVNDTTADLINSGIIKLTGNILNNQSAFQPANGTLLLKGSSRQVISGSSAFATFDLLINNSSGVILQNDFNTWNDISILSGVLDTDTFNISSGGNISSSNALNVKKGTLVLNGSTTQSIPANTFKDNRIANLTIKNDVQFNGHDTITGSILFGSDGNNLATGGLIVLKSDSNGTARINDITGGGIYSANSITGALTLERYIPARKAWRLLSAPVNIIGAPSINASWQEGITSGNPVPGYGVHITGGTTANGFDQSSTNLPSIKVYDNLSATFKGLPSAPGTNIPVSTYTGYFLYVRGDRSINLMQGANAAITSTTLRMRGNVNTGNHQVSVNPTGYTVAGNPFASAIDFKSLGRANVRNSFYMWDPALSGAYGLGSYVTFIWNNSTGEYDKTSSASPLSQYIPSGEAFIVQSADGSHSGTLTFKESDKTSAGSDDVFGRTNGLAQSIRVDLYSNADNALLDGVLNTFDTDNSNAVDMNDALKLQGTAENIAINRDGYLLAIERRAEVVLTDTIPLNFFRMRNQDYKLVIASNNMNTPGLFPFLIDNYSASGNRSLNPLGVTEVIFNINSDPASFSANRFKIVFKNLAVLPVTITTIKAVKMQEDIEVSWKTENEINIHHYEVERSSDGRIFSRIGSVSVTSPQSSIYSFIDLSPMPGINYYRVRPVSPDGSFSYSEIARVTMEIPDPSISIFPNPVDGDLISFRLKGIIKGTYKLDILNNLGQMVVSKTIYYNGLDPEFRISAMLPAGFYTVQLSGNGLNVYERLIRK